MQLRDVRKEIDTWPTIPELTQEFQEQWIKPLRAQGRSKSLISDFSPKLQKQVQQQLAEAQKDILNLKSHQIIPEKLHSCTRYLIELKLAGLNQDQHKMKMFRQKLQHDEFVNLHSLDREIASFALQVELVRKHYDSINEMLAQQWSLENTIYFSALPHKKSLKMISDLPHKYQETVGHLQIHVKSMVKK